MDRTIDFWNKIHQRIISDDPAMQLGGLMEARKYLSHENPQVDAAVRVGIVQAVSKFLDDDPTRFVS